MRKILAVTGTRAEYGVLEPVIKAIDNHPQLHMNLAVTGMHLLEEFGNTMKEIKFPYSRVEMNYNSDKKSEMAKALGQGIVRFTDLLLTVKPDIVLVIGDRDEALAPTLAALHLNIPIAHISGGDKTSGATIDESIRHAVTKLSHIHFPGSEQSAERLIKLGENSWRVFRTGNPALDTKTKANILTKEQLARKFNLNLDDKLLLVLQHPVTTQVEQAGIQMQETMLAIKQLSKQTIIIYPNADAGSRSMINIIEEYNNSFIKKYKNLSRKDFLSLVNAADVMIGNSSAALIEAPSFGTPAVNIGIRQQGRERTDNVIDCIHSKQDIISAINKAIVMGKRCYHSPFEAENVGEKIADILASITLDNKLLQKEITY